MYIISHLNYLIYTAFYNIIGRVKIQLTITKNRKIVREYPTPRRLTNFISSKAKTLLKNDSRIDIKVRYGKGFDNEIENCNLEDLIWANSAFVKEYL